ncbi:MAG: signal recognition particle-docking protein FtsY, partial [Gemmobacter sp.]
GEAMPAPELSAEELAAQEAAAAEKAEIERKVAEANRAWEDRQRREAEEAADEAVRAKAAAELKLLEERREHARLREEAAEAARAAAEAEANDPGLFGRLGEGLARSTAKLTEGLAALGRRKLDEDTLEELQDLLITSDMGTKVAERVTRGIAKGRFDREISGEEIRLALAEEIEAILKPREKVVDFSDGPRPRIVLFVGVNGSGKTTTIGKIASKLQEQGAKALLVAGDTFRAAAIEQLKVWGDRAGIPVMSGAPGADAAGLVYGAVERAQAEDLDLVLVDTAGRLQNKTELMSELGKIVRVVRKIDPDAPHDVILVLDATVGQNAMSQVEAFRHTADVTGLVMTKLDGTAKGGVLVAIAEAHDLPIHFIGIGEKAEDLRPFSAAAFAKALVGIKG